MVVSGFGTKKAARGTGRLFERSDRCESMALVGRLVAVVAAGRWLVVVIARLRWGLIAVVVLRVALILGVADHAAADAACGCADGCAFKAAAGLIADDAADSRAAEGAEDGTGLGVRATGTGCQGGTAQEDEDFVFHEDCIWAWCGRSKNRHFAGTIYAKECSIRKDFLAGDAKLGFQWGTSQVARARKMPMLKTSVAVVRKMLEAVAGSVPIRRSRRGM